MKPRSALRRLLITAASAATLTSCVLAPGTASLTFDGALAGQVDGPTVTCPPPASTGGDHSAMWVWTGQVGDRSVAVTATALNLTGIPSALLIRNDNTYWQATRDAVALPPGPGRFMATVSEKILHIEGIAKAMTPDTADVTIHGEMRCPD